MTGPPAREPVEERLADRLSARQAGAGPRIRAVALLRRLGRYDRAAYRAVARLSTPLLDEPLRRVSDFANFSKPAVGAASLVVNQPMKMAGERRRLRRRRRRRPAGAPATVAGGRLDRGVLPRLHRRALPERRPRRGRRRGHTRTTSLGSGALIA